MAQLEKSNDRGIRLEAIHVRGVCEMNSDDLHKYFSSFTPDSIEWIDDDSCEFLLFCAESNTLNIMFSFSTCPPNRKSNNVY